VTKKNLLLLALGLAILAGLYLTSLHSYLLFHSVAELFGIVVASAIFILTWNSRRFLDNTPLLFLGIAYLFIGVLDLIHMLAYKGMGIFPGYQTNLPTQLWIAARYMESLSLLIAPFLLSKKFKASVVFFGYSVITLLVITSIFGFKIFPTCFDEQIGLTPFKKISEYIISLILFASIVALSKRRHRFDTGTIRLLVASIGLTIASEMAFTYYVHAYGLTNLIGHYLKIVSFYLIYKAIVETGLQRPYTLLFRNLKETEAALRYRLSFEDIISKISARFIAMPTDKIDDGIEEALEEIGRFSNTDGGYVFQFSDNMKQFGMTHLWRNENLSTSKDVLQELDAGSMPWWMGQLANRKSVVVPSVDDLPKEASVERSLIASQGILSLVDVPMIYLGEVIGFMGFSCVRTQHNWSEDEISLIKMVGEVFTNALQRKKTEESLQESEERYRRIVSTAHEGIYLVDENTKIVFANKQMATMLGYTHEEISGRLLMDFIDEFAPVASSVDFSWDTNGSKRPRDFRFRRKDGSELWGMISSCPSYDDDGKFTGALGMVIDVTQRKDAEQELEKAHEQLKSFVDVVAHDLKNPILAIQGFSELFIRTHKERVGKKGTGYIEQIQASARQMSRLISDLLSLSSLGRMVPDFKHISAHEIVKTVSKRLSHMIEDNGIELVIADNLPNVYCDAKTIYQVFENLLSNAVKYTKKVDSPRIEVGYEDREEEHHFYVRDNGGGIDPEHHSRIFDMFCRLRDAEQEDGTGLGLAIVKKIVTKHGGKVWVESEKEQGAAFYFTLPKKP
jgi:PAS domain S-box-containing protein